MKVRVLRNTWYDASAYTIGEVYNAEIARDGRNYMVEDNYGNWLCMLQHELQLICPAVAVPGHAG